MRQLFLLCCMAAVCQVEGFGQSQIRLRSPSIVSSPLIHIKAGGSSRPTKHARNPMHRRAEGRIQMNFFGDVLDSVNPFASRAAQVTQPMILAPRGPSTPLHRLQRCIPREVPRRMQRQWAHSSTRRGPNMLGGLNAPRAYRCQRTSTLACTHTHTKTGSGIRWRNWTPQLIETWNTGEKILPVAIRHDG